MIKLYILPCLENDELGRRFRVTKDDYPTVILFVKNNQEGVFVQCTVRPVQ